MGIYDINIYQILILFVEQTASPSISRIYFTGVGSFLFDWVKLKTHYYHLTAFLKQQGSSCVKWRPSHCRVRRGKILTAVRITGRIMTWLHGVMFPQQHFIPEPGLRKSYQAAPDRHTGGGKEVINETEMQQNFDSHYEAEDCLPIWSSF